MAGLLLAIDAAMVVWFRVRPWTLLLPAWTLGFAVAGPNPRFAPWRDAVLTLGLITVVFALRVPRSWPMPARLAVNTPGTAGAVLLVIACIHNDGIGAAIRERSWRGLITSGRAALYGITAIVSLLISFGAATYLLREPTPLRLLLLATFVALNVEVLPAHWTRFRSEMGSLGCLGYILVIVGASSGAWSKGMLFIYLVAGGTSWSVGKLRQHVAGGPAESATGSPDEAISESQKREDPDPDNGSGSLEANRAEELSP